MCGGALVGSHLDDRIAICRCCRVVNHCGETESVVVSVGVLCEEDENDVDGRKGAKGQ